MRLAVIERFLRLVTVRAGRHERIVEARVVHFLHDGLAAVVFCVDEVRIRVALQPVLLWEVGLEPELV